MADLFLLLWLILNTQFFVFADPISARFPRRRTSYASQLNAPRSMLSLVPDLKRRQITSRQSTCGFKDGDPNQSRTADQGFDCRFDTLNALWGFCPTTVITATDCGLAGNCVDSHACTSGCGISGNSNITTFTCSGSGSDFCSSVLLTAGVDQTYTYIACGPTPLTEHLLATTTKLLESSTSPSSNTPTPAASSTAVSPPSTSLHSSSKSRSSPSTSLSSTSETTTPTNSTAASNSSTNNTGAIVGGVIGGVALLCFVGLAFMFLHKYRASRAESARPAQSDSMLVTDRYNETPKNAWTRWKTPSELPAHQNTLPPIELPENTSGSFHHRAS